MNVKNIFSNGLPMELKNLQDGQIYIYPNLNEGLTESNVLISQYISSVSGKLMKQSDVRNHRPAIFVIPTSNQALWDTIVCRIDTPKGVVYEIADRGSLMKMLYDYYGIDYDSVPKLKMSARYKITPTGGHPEKIYSNVFASDDTFETEAGYGLDSISMGFLTNRQLSKNEIKKQILTSLFEAERNKEKYGVDYDLEDILKEFYTEKDKDYRLEIVPEKDIRTKTKHKIPYIDCHIYITDKNNNRKELKLKPQQKAVYLMFLLYKDGIRINDFPKNEEEIARKKKYGTYLKLYSRIQSKLVDNNYIETPQLLQPSLTPIRTKIKDQLLDIIPNIVYVEKFAIEGYKEQPFKIEAATDKHRDSIIKAFELDPLEYGLE